MTRLTNPTPLFLDGDGALLDGGYIYVGVANADPVAQPLAVFWDQAQTIHATQPLRTLGGRVVNGAAPAQVFFSASDFSLRILDADQQLVTYNATSYADASTFQPLDADLTAIANAGTTDYGRGLLLLANQLALRNATGIPDPLPAIGGTVTGAIVRGGSGKYLHHSDPNLIGDSWSRGTPDPSGGVDGDFYFQYTA